MKKIITDEKINEVTAQVYDSYGSGTGVLFGIPSDLRPSVRAIIKLILKLGDDKK